MPGLAEIVGAAIGTALVSVFILVDLWSWMRDRWRIAGVAGAIFAGFIVWNVLISQGTSPGLGEGLAGGQPISIAILLVGSAAVTGAATVMVLALSVGRMVPPDRIGLAGAIVAGVTVLAVLFA